MKTMRLLYEISLTHQIKQLLLRRSRKNLFYQLQIFWKLLILNS